MRLAEGVRIPGGQMFWGGFVRLWHLRGRTPPAEDIREDPARDAEGDAEVEKQGIGERDTAGDGSHRGRQCQRQQDEENAEKRVSFGP
ncbi:MAG TPA: hypothetical protein VMT97_07715 [Terriglobales bacterium]|nr:hypothetical protein [Terriglobales bacterium]